MRKKKRPEYRTEKDTGKFNVAGVPFDCSGKGMNFADK